MHKFEDFMGKSNYEAFKLLVNAIRQDALVCYVGAGLSLYSKRWGEPFEIMVDELIGYAEDPMSTYDIEILKKHLHELYLLRYSLDRIKANGNSVELRRATARLKKSFSDVDDKEIAKYKKIRLYPEIGDKIEDIINASSLKIVKSEGVNTFNDWFCHAINKIKEEKCTGNNKEIHLSGNPYSFSSIYFLPYLGEKIKFITTNCDDSLEDIGINLNVYDKYQNSNWAKQCNLKKINNWTKKCDTNQIFYIHGHISEHDSLVMNQRDYDKTYPEGSVIKILHIDVITNYTLLFLGASLNNDKTVEIINQNSGALGQDADEHFIPIFTKKREENECKLINKKLISFDGNHHDISIILHQLIRETSTRNENIYSWKQDLNLEDQDIDPKLAAKVSRLLEGDENFKKRKFDTSQYDDILTFLCNHALLDAGEKGGPKWTLCQIYDSSFQFYEKDKNGPLHNYPLGNTIYMLGGSKKDSSGKPLDNEHLEKISKEIKYWIDKEYPNFDDDERFSELEGKKSGPLKVRIITFASPPLELSAYKKENLKSEKEDVQKKIDMVKDSLFKKSRHLMITSNFEMEQISQLRKTQNELDIQRLELSRISIEEDINDINQLVDLLFELIQEQQHKMKESPDIERQNINEDIAEMTKAKKLLKEMEGGR